MNSFDDIKDDQIITPYKRIAAEAKRLLLDKKYSEFGRSTDEELELANKIVFLLNYDDKIIGIENGLSLTELVVILLYDKDTQPKQDHDFDNDKDYLAKENKILRVIDLIKKMSLEAIVKDFLELIKDPKKVDEKANIPIFVCSSYSEQAKMNLYYSPLANPKDTKRRQKLLKEWYAFLGFDFSHHSFPYFLTKKGAGLVRIPDINYHYPGDDKYEEENINDPEITKHYEEADDIIANLKGDYTTKAGLHELLDLVEKFYKLMQGRTSIETGLTDKQLMHELIPASVTATGIELELYKTKISDVLYFIHRTEHPSRKYKDKIIPKQHRYVLSEEQKQKEREEDARQLSEEQQQIKRKDIEDGWLEVSTKRGIVTGFTTFRTVTYPASKDSEYFVPFSDLVNSWKKEGYTEVQQQNNNHVVLKKVIDGETYNLLDIETRYNEEENEIEVLKYTRKYIVEEIEEDGMTLEELEQRIGRMYTKVPTVVEKQREREVSKK